MTAKFVLKHEPAWVAVMSVASTAHTAVPDLINDCTPLNATTCEAYSCATATSLHCPCHPKHIPSCKGAQTEAITSRVTQMCLSLLLMLAVDADQVQRGHHQFALKTVYRQPVAS
ncbi:TPA: hypothetical protein ACH3X1_004416 [Trebouxia sp. C0004]